MSNLLPDGPSGYHLLVERAHQEGFDAGYAQAIKDVVEALRERGEGKAVAGSYWLCLAPADFIERRFSGEEGS